MQVVKGEIVKGVDYESQFFGPGNGILRDLVLVCLCVCVCLFVEKKNFNSDYDIWTIRDLLHIWHAYSTLETFSNDTKADDLVTLNVTFHFWQIG